MARLLFICRKSNQMWKITVGLVALQLTLPPRGGSPPVKPAQGHRQPESPGCAPDCCLGHQCPTELPRGAGGAETDTPDSAPDGEPGSLAHLYPPWRNLATVQQAVSSCNHLRLIKINKIIIIIFCNCRPRENTVFDPIEFCLAAENPPRSARLDTWAVWR